MHLVASWIPGDTHLQSGYLNDDRSGELGCDVCDCLRVCSESVTTLSGVPGEGASRASPTTRSAHTESGNPKLQTGTRAKAVICCDPASTYPHRNPGEKINNHRFDSCTKDNDERERRYKVLHRDAYRSMPGPTYDDMAPCIYP